MTKKLFILDAMALIYRAHFAFIKNPRITSKGLNTSATLGFTNTLVDVMTKEKPSHIVVAFDTPAPTWRHITFPAYKEHRQAQPEDITVAIPYVKKILAAFRIPVLALEGYEADDVIGTLALQAAKEGFEVYMMTPDKDFAQLVNEHIYLYRPGFMGNGVVILDTNAVLEKWGIAKVDQIRDLLALQGDAVDNIPGIPSIGEKTAQKLIAQFDTVENLIANTDQLTGKLRENVEKYAQQGLLSKELATIHTNAPINFDMVQSLYQGPDRTALKAIFQELEFNTLSRRVLDETNERTTTTERTATTESTTTTTKLNPGTQGSLFDLPSITSSELNSKKSPNSREDLNNKENLNNKESFNNRDNFNSREDLNNRDNFNSREDLNNRDNLNSKGSPNTSEDVATSSITAAPTATPLHTIYNTKHQYHLIDTPALRKELVNYLQLQRIFCFDTETTSLDPHQAKLVGIAFAYYPGEAYYVPIPTDQQAAQAIVDEFRPLFENTTQCKVGQNLKYDNLILRQYGVAVSSPIFDTMVAHYLVEPDRPHNMNAMSASYLHYSPIHIEELIGAKKSTQKNMRDIDVHLVKDYSCEDADITLQLKAPLEQSIKQQQLDKLFYEIELPLVQVLTAMEYQGVQIDVRVLQEISGNLAIEIRALEKEIYELAGCTFNLSSPKQLGEILFDQLKIAEKPKKTKSGQYATSELILTDFAHTHPIINKIRTHRELQKLKSTYVDALPNLISPIDGRIHTSYNQTVVVTGRLSSTNPNLQNIPIRTEKGKTIREAFIPHKPDYILLSADYSQIELRIMASFSQDETMIQAFKEGKDIHAATASKLFKVPIEEVDQDMRRQAKTANFGIIYGISAFGLAQRLGISRTEAGAIIEAYFKEFPAVKTYIDQIINQGREQGYVTTLMGRKKYLRDINSRNATLRGFDERNAINAPIQGTAAEMIKLAMIHIYAWLEQEKLQSKLILQVHDELIFDVPNQEVEIVKDQVTLFMKNALSLNNVPIEVQVGMGKNWSEAH